MAPGVRQQAWSFDGKVPGPGLPGKVGDRVEPHERCGSGCWTPDPRRTVPSTTYKEGEYLLQPGFGRGGAGVLDLQPAQGGFVEFGFDEPGLYPIVTHKFANVAKAPSACSRPATSGPPTAGIDPRGRNPDGEGAPRESRSALGTRPSSLKDPGLE